MTSTARVLTADRRTWFYNSKIRFFAYALVFFIRYHTSVLVLGLSVCFIGHPSARVTSQDGQYTLHAYVKKGGVKSDKFPAGQRLTAQYTIDLRPFRYGYLFGGLQEQ